MRKTKYLISGFIIIFLILLIFSMHQIESFSPLFNDLNLNEENNEESWSKFVKTGSQLYGFHSTLLIDENIYVMGSLGEYITRDDIYIAKFNRSGVKLWEQVWDDSKYDSFRGYVLDSEDNVYILCLSSDTNFYGDSGKMFLLKYNSSGNLLWSKLIDPFNGNFYHLYSISIDLNDSILLTCRMNNYTETSFIEVFFITKISTSGIILWTEEIELYTSIEYIRTEIDSEGNIYICSRGINEKLFLLKLNSSNSIQWNYEFGRRDSIYKMTLDSAENIILTGTTYSSDWWIYEVWIMKINNSGFQTDKKICKSSKSYSNLKEVWFLDNIYILVSSTLLKFNYSLNSIWNFTFADHMQAEDPWNYKFGLNSKQEMYLLYDINTKIRVIHFNSSNVISYFNWGGYFSTQFYSFSIDTQDNLFILCNQHYGNVWSETITLSLLIKNPVNGGRAPQLDHPIDDRDIFIFSLLGVMSFISVTLVYNTLKPKLRDLLGNR